MSLEIHGLTERRNAALAYLGQRTGTLEYRFLRYAAVADELFARGLDDAALLVDLGAGTCDFDFYLRTVRGWKGRYRPVDASIDGTDLNYWTPPLRYDFAVAIEVLEHLVFPLTFLDFVVPMVGVLVATTPNTDVLGVACVKEMDATHVSPLTRADLVRAGAARVEERTFFGRRGDTLLAVWGSR